MFAAGIEHGAFHRLRHSCGTQLRRRGASLEEVQLHLGHEDLSFTRRVYVHLDASDGPTLNYLTTSPGAMSRSRRRFRWQRSARATGGNTGQHDAPKPTETTGAGIAQ
jgi:hypothetical protein